MILAIGFLLLVAGAAVIWALTEGYLGGDSTDQELLIGICGLVLAVAGFAVLVVGALTGNLAGG